MNFNERELEPVRLAIRLGRQRVRALKHSFETTLEDRKGEVSLRMQPILTGLYSEGMWMDDRIDKVSAENKKAEPKRRASTS